MIQFLNRVIHAMSPRSVFFTHRGFYDVPEAMLARIKRYMCLFVRYFDEEHDDYEQAYTVYELSGVAGFDQEPIWRRIDEFSKAELCKIAVSQIEFDSTQRARMKSSPFEVIPVASTTVQSN